MKKTITILAFVLLATCTYSADTTEKTEPAKIPNEVSLVLNKHCLVCHGENKQKGEMALHTISNDFVKDRNKWELVLEQLEDKQMPPEDQPQPSVEQRAVVVAWVEKNLRAASIENQEPKARVRRLTNFEYENTMRDLLGFELKLIKNLPEDPIKPYKFNNTPEFMLMGTEQMDRYKENARRAMASAIVDPAMPKIHKTRREWKLRGDAPTNLRIDEIGVYGNRRGSPAGGMGLKSWPKTGEYRIRMQAAAILPKGVKEMPLRLVMGYGLGENSATLEIEEVGTATVRNNVDNPKIYEYRGRIENHPARPGIHSRKTGKRATDTMAITPQNLYDDGTLNDRVDPMAKPRAVVQWIEFEAPVFESWPPKHHTDILFKSPLRKSDSQAYVKEVLKRFMTRAFRRPVKKEEIENFANIYRIVSRDLPSMEAAMRETLAMVLISPDFLYHTVAKQGGENRQYEMASKLSYFLWGSMPDAELIESAKKGKLNDAKIIEQQVRRLLKDARSRDFVDNFTTQWLSIAKMKQVKINLNLFPRFLYIVNAGERRGTEVPYRPTIRDDMHEESVGFIAELIKRNASVMNIVDSDFAYLNERLANHYGVEGVQGHQLRPVDIKPEHNLGGLLTHGSVLIGNSTGSAPHPIYRAVWLREAIIGDDVKPPPADVPSLTDSVGESAEQALSIKDLLALHRKKDSCKDCHVRLDPWGIPFERYNAIGKFQSMVPKEKVRVSGFNKTTHKDMSGYLAYLKKINTVKVQAEARVPHGPEVDGMSDLKKHLLKNRKHDIAENMIRRLLTYGIGRELSYRDRYAVKELLKNSKQNDYKIKDLIISICKSKAFAGAN